MEELARLNPCIRFILDNYDMLCIAHPNKVVLVVDEYVARTFDSMFDAMRFTRAVDMINVPYAMKECNGTDPESNLIYSVACKTPD